MMGVLTLEGAGAGSDGTDWGMPGNGRWQDRRNKWRMQSGHGEKGVIGNKWSVMGESW